MEAEMEAVAAACTCVQFKEYIQVYVLLPAAP